VPMGGRRYCAWCLVRRRQPAARCKSDDGAVACGVINGDVKDWRGEQRNVSGYRNELELLLGETHSGLYETCHAAVFIIHAGDSDRGRAAARPHDAELECYRY